MSELYYIVKVDQNYWQNSIINASLLCVISIVYDVEGGNMVFSVVCWICELRFPESVHSVSHITSMDVSPILFDIACHRILDFWCEIVSSSLLLFVFSILNTLQKRLYMFIDFSFMFFNISFLLSSA